MNLYGLFSGTGQFERGLSVAGFDLVGCCEIDEFRRDLLRLRHGVEATPDVHDVGEGVVQEEVFALCGGFP